MSKPSRITGTAWSAVVGALFAIAALVVAASAHIRGHPAHDTLEPLGLRLPSLSLTDLDGQQVELRQYIGARPAILFIVGVADCASCANVPFELVIAKKQTPALKRVVVASGASAERFRPYIEKMGNLEAPVLVDEHHLLLDSLRLTSEPVTLVADSTGRVLFVDKRSTSQAAQLPVGRVLHELVGILTAR